MKILVINIALRPPPARKWIPVGLGYIASAIKRAGYSFELLDLDACPQSPETTDAYLKSHKYDVVIMGCIVTGYKYVKWLAKTIKDAYPDTTIIVGNTVATSIPNLLLTKTNVDIAVIGEGDITIVELLRCIENKDLLKHVEGICYKNGNDIVANPLRQPIVNIDEIPIPDWEIFDINLYISNISASLNEPLPPIPKNEIRAMPVNTARGCPFKCTFCSHAFQAYKYRHRSIEMIIKEMQYYNEKWGINYFCFNDELTFYSIKQAESFADAILASGMKIFWEGSCRSGLFSEDEHIDIARKLKQSGAQSIAFSLESADPEILEWMNKKATVEMFSKQVNILDAAGLASRTSIVIGYPNETEASIKATLDCCIKNGLYPSAGYLLPLPGSEMYDYAVQQGFIKDEEKFLLEMGDRQDLHINLTKYSDHELVSIVKREMSRCSDALKLDIVNGDLLKTGFYRSTKES